MSCPHFFLKYFVVSCLQTINNTKNLFQLPKDSEGLTQWIYDRFAEKEEILEGFYKTGSFLFTSANTPTVVQQDMLRYVIIHLFFITSTYVHLQMFSTLYSCYHTYIYSVMT